MLPFCFEESAPVAHAMGKNATKPAQIVASLIQARKQKENGYASIYCLICVPCVSHVM